ncbi:MAG TPA: hypothetical protein VL332_04880 [Candidatus Saccharimonadaceae bacterium]|jgi:hypothetical protein|nr:hypothetical protein [Candidatus Saccharimonadaceae bacterium]
MFHHRMKSAPCRTEGLRATLAATRQLATLALALGVAAAALPAPSFAAFEDIEVSPAARASGGAWSAVIGDEYAPFHNPAALAWTTRSSVAGSFVRPFGYDFSSQNAAAVNVPLPRALGGASIGLRRFGVDFQGQHLMDETTVAIAQGFHLLRDRQSELAVGWALDVYALSFGRSVTGIDPGNASTVGLTFGALAIVRDRTRVGFRVENLNGARIGDRDKEELHRRVAAGLAYTPYSGVQTLLDMSGELGDPIQYRGGVAFEASSWMTLRAGVRTEPAAFTAGMGLAWSGVRLDYGYSGGGGVLGDTQHVGLTYQFGKER